MTSTSAASVTKNIAVLSVARVMTTSSTLVLMMFLPRCLGPVKYGRLYLGQSIVMIFTQLIQFGGNYSITKEVARHPDRAGSIVANSLALRGVLWAISFLFMLGYGIAVGYPSEVVYIIAIFGVGAIFTSAGTVFGSSYRGIEILKYNAYSVITETAFVAAVGIAALLGGIGPVAFAAINITGSLLSMAILLKHRHILFVKIPRIDWRGTLVLMKKGVPYFLNTVFGIIYYRIDTVMLSLMTPEKVVGWYGASYRFFDSVMTIPNIFTLAIFPVLAREWNKDAPSASGKLQRSLDFIILTGIPVGILIFISSPQIIHFFYGSVNYQPSVFILQIFSIGIPLLYIDFVLGTILLASDMQSTMSKISFAAIFVNVFLNYFFIPYTQLHGGNGGIGSALATLITELYVMVNMVMLMPRTHFGEDRIAVQVKSVMAGVCMIIAIQLAGYWGAGWAVRCVAGAGAYCALLFTSKAFTDADRDLVLEYVARFSIGRRVRQFWTHWFAESR